MDKPTFISTSKFPDDMRIKVGPKYPDKTMELPIKGKDKDCPHCDEPIIIKNLTDEKLH